MKTHTIRACAIAALCAAFLNQHKAFALLHLTPDGTAEGMQLSVFSGEFPSQNNIGPIGILVLSDGVLASDHLGNIRKFPTDTDNQHATDIPVAQNYGVGNANGFAQIGSAIYVTGNQANNIYQINPDGTFLQNIASIGGFQLVVNPANHHLLLGDEHLNAIMDVNPTTGVAITVASSPDPDGLALSPDGTIVYAAAQQAGGGGHILGYNIATGIQVYDSGPVDGTDGLVIGTGLFNGDIFTNTNTGNVVQINLATNAQTIIANGGNRGDLMYLDPTNGSLLVTQSTGQWRISLPTPEPATAPALAIAIALLGSRRRKTSTE